MHRQYDIAQRLAQMPIFQQCTRKEIDQITSITDRVELSAGTVLCTEGSSAHECFIIVEGTADVTVDGQRVATVGAGETVGEMGLIDHDLRSATVTVTTPMVAYVIEGRRFEALVASTPHVARGLLRQTSSRLRGMDESTGHDTASG